MSKEKIKQAIAILQSLLEDGFKLEGKYSHWTDLGNGKFKDNKTGLIWGPTQDGYFNHRDAKAKFGNALPTIEEFLESEKNGIRYIFDMKDRYFWSASVYCNDEDGAFVLNGNDGDVDIGGRDYDYGSVVCVER